MGLAAMILEPGGQAVRASDHEITCPSGSPRYNDENHRYTHAPSLSPVTWKPKHKRNCGHEIKNGVLQQPGINQKMESVPAIKFVIYDNNSMRDGDGGDSPCVRLPSVADGLELDGSSKGQCVPDSWYTPSLERTSEMTTSWSRRTNENQTNPFF